MGIKALSVRRRVGQLLLGAAAALLTGLCRNTCGAQPPPRIPPLQGAVLSGEQVALPAKLQGKVGVLVVGFSQASRADVTAWAKRLAGDYRDNAGVLYYELPVLAAVPRLLRGWVLKKMAADIPDRAKGRFLPVYDHEAEWRVAAGYTRADDAYVMIVDGAGVVRFRTEGDANDAAYAEVKKRIEAMR